MWRRWQEVNLSLNEVTEEGVEALGAFLGAAPHLQRLSLRENELEDGGAVQLAASLTALSSLQDLDLCANQVRPACCLFLFPASKPGWPHAPAFRQGAFRPGLTICIQKAIWLTIA